MLQAFLVVPAFGLALPAGRARTTLRGAARPAGLAAAPPWWSPPAGGCWRQLTPAADRPYIGGSQNNSLWNLIFGYNGFGRLTGNETGSVGGGGGRRRAAGAPTGLTRLFGADMGGADLLAAAGRPDPAGRRAGPDAGGAPRTDRTRAALVLWGGWLLVTGLAFSFGQGIIHPYYTVALAPAIGALIGIGGAVIWARRHRADGRALARAGRGGHVRLGLGADATQPDLDARSPGCSRAVGRGLRPGVVGVVGDRPGGPSGGRRPRRWWPVSPPPPPTPSTRWPPRTRAPFPSAGPAVTGATGAGPGRGAGFAGGGGAAASNGAGSPLRRHPGGSAPGVGGGGFGSGLRGGPGGAGGSTGAGGGTVGRGPGAGDRRRAAQRQPAERGAGLVSSRTAPEATDWVLATVGANEAAGYQLSTGDAVMAIGGFNGTDPAPTLAEFEKLVAAGKIHYFIGGWWLLISAPGPGAGGVDGRPRSPTGWKPTSIPRPSGA